MTVTNASLICKLDTCFLTQSSSAVALCIQAWLFHLYVLHSKVLQSKVQTGIECGKFSWVEAFYWQMMRWSENLFQ
jgi:hypothetical protein